MGASFIHPTTGNIITDHAVQYVDDKTQLLNANGAGISPQTTLNKMSQHHQSNHELKKLKVKYDKLDTSTGGIAVHNPADGQEYALEHVHPTTARRTLGVMLAPDGSGSSKMKITTEKAQTFLGKLKYSNLSNKDK